MAFCPRDFSLKLRLFSSFNNELTKTDREPVVRNLDSGGEADHEQRNV